MSKLILCICLHICICGDFYLLFFKHDNLSPNVSFENYNGPISCAHLCLTRDTCVLTFTLPKVDTIKLEKQECPIFFAMCPKLI